MSKAELEVIFLSLDSVSKNFVYGILVGDAEHGCWGASSAFTFLTTQTLYETPMD